MLKHWIAQRNRSSRSALNTPCGLCPSEAPWSGFLCCMAASISFLILFSSDVCVSSLRHPSSDNDWSFSSSVLLVALISKSKMWRSNLKNKQKPPIVFFLAHSLRRLSSFLHPQLLSSKPPGPLRSLMSGALLFDKMRVIVISPFSVSFTLLLPNRGRVGKKLLFGLDNNREHFWSLWTKDCLILSFVYQFVL